MVAPKPKPRRTQAERREETRARILEAAVSELKQKGYAGFRVNEVALSAHVSRGAQTHHFPTKESLLIAALRQIYVAQHAKSMKLIESLGPGDSVFDALMRDSEVFYLGPNFTISVTMLSQGSQEPELRKQLRIISRTHRLPVEAAWQSALESSGLPEEDARSILYMTQSIFRGMAIRRFMRNDPEYISFTIAQWRKMAEAQIDLFLKPNG